MLTGSCRLSQYETDDAVKLKRVVVRKGSVLCDIFTFRLDCRPALSDITQKWIKIVCRCMSTLKDKIREAIGSECEHVQLHDSELPFSITWFSLRKYQLKVIYNDPTKTGTQHYQHSGCR